MSPSTQASVSGPLPPPNFISTITSQLIGVLLSWFLLGTFVIQVYIYRVYFHKDPLFLKILVYFVFLSTIVCACLQAADMAFWFGVGFGDPTVFKDARNSGFYSPLMGSLIATLVQLFFCYRICVIKRAAWPLCIPIVVCALVQFAGGIGGVILLYSAEGLGGPLSTAHVVLLYFWPIGGAVADVLIAAIMAYLLLGSGSGLATRNIVKNVVRITVEINCLPTAVSLLALVLFYSIPETGYWYCPVITLSNIYANTLLATLNNRVISRKLAEADSYEDMGSFHGQPRFTATLSRTVTSTSMPEMSFAPRAEKDVRKEEEIGSVSACSRGADKTNGMPTVRRW
ncbi:hypothetical protein C8R43DRAFT_1003802 [Mycena crocata]|nr:hypothetical protein C8R43DRAFT_1003802 [Mycena crocata]